MAQLTPRAFTQVLPERVASRDGVLGRFAWAFVFRFLCITAMTWLAVWAEARSAPSLPDTVLHLIPYSFFADRWNYILWTAAYLPVATVLLVLDVERFCRYMIAGGWVALLRGFTIAATGLGAVGGGPDLHAGLSAAQRLDGFAQLSMPLGALFGHHNPFYLTKDLFFSGHTASTFLLVLYVWKFPKLRWWMLFAHALVVVCVFFAHLHYTIDVLGAYAFSFGVFCLMEADLRGALRGEARPDVG